MRKHRAPLQTHTPAESSSRFSVLGISTQFAIALLFACSSRSLPASERVGETVTACSDGEKNGDETGVDCGGICNARCSLEWEGSTLDGGAQKRDASGGDGGGDADAVGDPFNGARDGDETDVDCGGSRAPKCGEGQGCVRDDDCNVACNDARRCVTAPSCRAHLGGDTCGKGEVGEPGAAHESCCRTLVVPGYADPLHPGATVYLDKYEITAGRIRSFIAQMTAASGGRPDIKAYIASHRPALWDNAWSIFLPEDVSGASITIARRLLGDPRTEDSQSTDPPGPGVILPPATDQTRNLGVDYQFGAEVYVDLHGSNCGTFLDSFGFPTYYYTPAILSLNGELARASGLTSSGQMIAAQDLLDVKSVNCISNAMLAAFCHWDGGQLATDEVLDFVTDTPASLGNTSGCGSQVDDHDKLLRNVFTGTVQVGGRCAPVAWVNASFDAGDSLPVAGSALNRHNYHYPDTGAVTHDKAWQIAAPGRASLATAANGQATDVVRINPGDEPWMDLHGNLSEAALDMEGSAFTGRFALKYRGIGYGTSRSELNVSLVSGEAVLRVQRPEAKAATTGGRCMRFR
jgi:hypothetical protein